MKNALGIRDNRIEGNYIYTHCENLTVDEIVVEQSKGEKYAYIGNHLRNLGRQLLESDSERGIYLS